VNYYRVALCKGSTTLVATEDGRKADFQNTVLYVILGFCHDGYYTAQSGNSVPVFQDNLLVPPSRVKDFLTLEGGTDSSSQNVGTELPLYAAQYPRRAHIS
jgi:hypothetical protein